MATDSDNLADRLDDLGIGILASPYIAKAVGGLAGRIPALKGVQSAANAYEHAFHASPYGEIAGLSLVAPGVVKPLAKALTPTEKTAYWLGRKHAMQQMSVGGYTREEARKLYGPQADLDEVTEGLNDELEHRDLTKGNDQKTKSIVDAHLREDPHYYEKIKRVLG